MDPLPLVPQWKQHLLVVVSSIHRRSLLIDHPKNVLQCSIPFYIDEEKHSFLGGQISRQGLSVLVLVFVALAVLELAL